MSGTRVLVIYTGGTIGMGPRDIENPASPLIPKPLADLVAYVPGLEKKGDRFVLEVGAGIDIDFIGFHDPIDSSDVKPIHWREIARLIKKHYDNFDGFVVLHGTDTMAYTTSVLAFMLQNLSKPVVVTGSQLPISYVRNDAVQNLINSFHVAGYAATNLPKIPEVVLLFHDKILRGCRATKISAADLDGFSSPNYPPLGKIGEHIVIDRSLINEDPSGRSNLVVADEIGSDSMQDVYVVDVSLHPAFQPGQLRAILGLPNVRGAVLRTFGTGNAQSDPDLLNVLEEAISRTSGTECVVVNVTQCLQGTVEMGLYAASSGLLERGVVSGMDLTPEAAFAKLYWTLATQHGSEITAQMQINQRGEQTLNLFDLNYGPSQEMDAEFDVITGTANPDRRFKQDLLSRAVVRMSGVRLQEAKEGESFEVRVFMNKPRASRQTRTDDPHCVAVINDRWSGGPATLLAEITEKAQSVIDQGAITLTLIIESESQLSFQGLYLALFSRAE